MTFGNLVALVQQNLLRLLAYSTVAQTGYFLIGALTYGRTTGLAVPSLLMFGVAYATMNTGAFAIVLSSGRTLTEIAGFGRNRPVAGAAMAVFLFSLVGIPPLAGFAGKFLLFGAALDTDFRWLAVIAILNSVISLGVYLRIIYPMLFKVAGHEQVISTEPLVRWSWGVCLAVTLVVGLGVQMAFYAI